MSIQLKKTFANIILVLFLVWPFAHRLIAEIYLINPWKYFGWAMYCVPAPGVGTEFSLKANGQWKELKLSLELVKFQKEFHFYRANRGRLHSPKKLVDAIRNSMDLEPQKLKIKVTHRRYDIYTNKMVDEISTLEF